MAYLSSPTTAGRRYVGSLTIPSQQGALGETFSGQTTVELNLSRPLRVDISGIPDTDMKLPAAVLLACWAEGFAGIEAAQALAEAGTGRDRWFDARLSGCPTRNRVPRIVVLPAARTQTMEALHPHTRSVAQGIGPRQSDR